jgi:hypothetical protein
MNGTVLGVMIATILLYIVAFCFILRGGFYWLLGTLLALLASGGAMYVVLNSR